MTALEQLRAFARYKTHPGYSWAAVMADGELLCESCVRENYRIIYGALTRPGHTMPQWKCIGLTNSSESETTEYCANCDKVLWEHEA